MRLKHKKPCSECPWRKDAPAGWLGGAPDNFYTDAFMSGEVTACHKHDHGPASDDTAFCAGALSVMSNQCKEPTGFFVGQETAKEARREVGRRDDTFSHAFDFHKHHHGKPWQHLTDRNRE